MADQEKGGVRSEEGVHAATDKPRREFMEKAGLLAGGLVVLGAPAAQGQAVKVQAEQAPNRDRPIVELAGVTREYMSNISPRAMKLTLNDMVALASGEKRPTLSGLTVGDIKSLNEVLFNSLTVLPPDGDPGFRPRPKCCSCSCSVI